MATPRRTDAKLKREKTKDDLKTEEGKLKKSIYTVSTPRDYVQKSSYADIYAQKKKVLNKAPKKVPGSTQVLNTSPMTGLLRSTSTISLNKAKNDSLNSSRSQKYTNSPVTSKKVVKTSLEAKSKNKDDTKKVAQKEVLAKEAGSSRKFDTKAFLSHKDMGSSKKFDTKESLSKEVRSSRKLDTKESISKDAGSSKKFDKKEPINREVESSKRSDSKEVPKPEERQRTKTRTLDESEVKILTPEIVDNNTEMLNLTKKLVGRPKAFYVDLDEDNVEKRKSQSEEEVSYEDDFESYESDFDSYHSEDGSRTEESEHETARELRVDEDNMVDSGNYNLPYSSLKKDAVDSDDDKRVSLTDEGFQEMSGSSAVCSMKHDSLDRPMFLDFAKAKQRKAKRLIYERFKQRAMDLLSMISLHEIYYTLFEMKPISYELYMAMFGKNNYTQIGVQTFDDGITEGTQTDELATLNKWTQNPVDFTYKNIVYKNDLEQKYCKDNKENMFNFDFMLNPKTDGLDKAKILTDEKFDSNPLRIYLEQKDGAGSDEMLPYEIYKSKLKNNQYNAKKLCKFLKKHESRISYYLNRNVGSNLTGLSKTSKLPFSSGHISISNENFEEKFNFLKTSVIVNMFLSQNKNYLLLTEHREADGMDSKMSLVCLWDLSVAREPVKILTAIDSISIGRFVGDTSGIFVAALNDGTIHLWDLSEEPYCHLSVANAGEYPQIQGKEDSTGTEEKIENNRLLERLVPLQSSAYTNSAFNMSSENLDQITGLIVTTETNSLDPNKKIIGQVISLQSMGTIKIWSIVQEKINISTDIGKAYWSRMKLELYQTINLLEQVDFGIIESKNSHFSLNSAKKRLNAKKTEKSVSRVKSDVKCHFDRPSSVASLRKKVLPVEINVPNCWETGVFCTDLKLINFNNANCFLVGKNGGEVLCCRKCLGVVKVSRFCVSVDTSTVINIEVSKNRPQFLATTDCGTLNLFSLLDNRVLLTLDCRNIPPSANVDKCQSDHKGRFAGSVQTKTNNSTNEYLSINSTHWCQVNPCVIHVLTRSAEMLTFDLTRSDIVASRRTPDIAKCCAHSDRTLAILTPSNKIEVHKIADDKTVDYENIYEKYVALL